jgi:hypothetical protein
MRFELRSGRWFPLALVALLAACGEERAPVDYVQPLALEKSFFIGEDFDDPADNPVFWTRASVVDVGYGADQFFLFTSTSEGALTRIKWSIEKDLLLARLAYERIEGSDGKGAGAGASSDDGVVVAAFPIEKHFDIQRRYNPATGEEYNIVEENSTDRPWYERRYFRVDWSTNLATDTYDFDTLSALGKFGVRYEPLAYHVEDPAHEDAPHFALKEGYFDVTTKAFAVPEMLDISRFGWGVDRFPACTFDADFPGGTAPVANCNPSEITVRHSFRRVVDRDYEPQDWDGLRFQAFGAFTMDRYGYERNYGLTDTNYRRMIRRYNLWERSHYYADPVHMEGPVECYTPETTPAGSDPNRDELQVVFDEHGQPQRDAAGKLVLAPGADGTADECQEVTLLTGFGGSRCDSFSQRCTLPYRARKAVPQVWYFSTGSHPEYFDGTAWAAHEWDVALRSAVMTARYAECQRVGDEGDCETKYPVWHGQMDDAADAIALAREVDDCRAGRAYAGRDCLALADELGQARGYAAGVIAAAKEEELVVLCHSPVQADDPEPCGGPRLPADLTAADCFAAAERGDRETMAVCRAAKNARKGDLRYHLVNAIARPQTFSPWGIMADAADPLTGEKVSSSINVWTHVTDIFAQRAVDLARYIRGELSTEDVTEGTYIEDWSMVADAATRNGALPPMTREAVESRLGAAVGLDAAGLARAREEFEARSPALKERLATTARQLEHVRADAYAAATLPVVYRNRREKALGSSMEAALTTRMMQQFAGVEGLGSRMVQEFASPLRAANPTEAREFRQLRENAIAQRGGCLLEEAQAPLGIADLAAHLEKKFGPFNPQDSRATQLARAERMRRYIAQRAHYSTIVHEMGHSVGLRHNFVGSADAFGYWPQYWQLRTKNGTLNRRCQAPGTDEEGLQPDGNCVGPRFFDPITEEEKENLIWMFMHNTTMDYHGETTQDLLGLGVYDFAAARMFYGESMAVFADDDFQYHKPRGQGMLDKIDNFGGILGLRPRIGDGKGGLRNLHYSDYQREYQLITDCRPVDPDDFRPATWNEERDGEWSALLDGRLVQVDGTYSRCRQQPVDYVNYDAMQSIGRDAAGDVAGKTHDARGRVRVPYGFATDHWADLGNASVYRHDNGADPYELFDFLITQQEVGHIFNNYRRNRTTFSVRGAFGSSLGYNEKMRDAAKGLGLMANVYRDIALENHLDYHALWAYAAPTWFRDNLLASTIAFDHFTRMLQRPEAGPHFLPSVQAGAVQVPVDTVWRSVFDSNSAPINAEKNPRLVVPNGATGRYGNVSWGGRPVENRLADDRGDYNSQFTANAGSYYEKAFSTVMLTESVDNFISDSRNDFIDPRYRSVSLADLFPDGFRRWLGNNLTGDDEVKGVRIAARTDSLGRLVPDVTDEKYPVGGLGWTSWTPVDGPQACFADRDALTCTAAPEQTVVVDPQVGWEQQKFLIAFTLQYLPENQQQTWLNQMYLWEVGADADPGFQNRIEFHDPSGRVYVAKTFGKETVFGKRVQKGIAARVLEYANELLAAAYHTTPGPDRDGDGAPDWYVPELGEDGQPMVRFDPMMSGDEYTRAHCNAEDESGCTCEANSACVKLQRYVEVPFFLRQALDAYDLADPSMRGIY